MKTFEISNRISARLRSTYTLKRTIISGCVCLCLAAITTSAARAEEDSDWKIEITPRSTEPLAQADFPDAPEIVPMRVSAQPNDSTIEITPRPSINADQPTDPAPAEAAVDPDLYERVYRSIPYSRIEYEANPGYRHQAAMSLILGQPYAAGPGTNYKPRALTHKPFYRRPTRPLFGYRPYILRSFPGLYDFYYYYR